MPIFPAVITSKAARHDYQDIIGKHNDILRGMAAQRASLRTLSATRTMTPVSTSTPIKTNTPVATSTPYAQLGIDTNRATATL